VPLGSAAEYWDPEPTHYEGWQQLRDRLVALRRTPTKPYVAYHLSQHLLEDVIVACGGVELAIMRLRNARRTLTEYASMHDIKPKDEIPLGLGHDGATEAWYAFADLLFWARTFVERLKRPPLDRKKFPEQGLIPALRPKRLKKKCERLLNELRAGPVGQARPLANFMLHSALVRHPFSGVEFTKSGDLVLPIPDLPSRVVSHWYLLTWNDERDGFAFAEELWKTIERFVDGLLNAFEKAVPKRLRKLA